MSELISTYRGTVMPWHCDHMGHMNVMWEVRDKVAKFVHEMRNAHTGEISAVCMLTGVHIDARTRKSCPFPDEILRRARSLVRAYTAPA
jgi:acyl-CoA thioesterase FadM